MFRGPEMNDLKLTLLTDGSSDQVLIRHLEWLVHRHVAPTTTIQLEWADLRSLREKPAGLSERIERALEFYPCDLLFVHRDAEKQDPQFRYDEITAAFESVSGEKTRVVGVDPVRMQEAWLLFDESAIRKAAGNPNGKDDLGLPAFRNLESLPDPKAVLVHCLRTASGLAGRRLRQFRGRQAARRVAEYIEDFSPLLGLDAFRKLDSDIQDEFQRRGWKRVEPQ